MQIRARNVVFVYRNGDADSLEVANHYRDERGVPADQIISINNGYLIGKYTYFCIPYNNVFIDIGTCINIISGAYIKFS